VNGFFGHRQPWAVLSNVVVFEIVLVESQQGLLVENSIDKNSSLSIGAGKIAAIVVLGTQALRLTVGSVFEQNFPHWIFTADIRMLVLHELLLALLGHLRCLLEV
jgi:hypothetical protein